VRIAAASPLLLWRNADAAAFCPVSVFLTEHIEEVCNVCTLPHRVAPRLLRFYEHRKSIDCNAGPSKGGTGSRVTATPAGIQRRAGQFGVLSSRF
jgi:hypothetical protein